MPLPPPLSEEYQKKGFVGPICVLSPTEAKQSLKEYFAWANKVSHHNEERKGGVTGSLRFKPHLHLPFANRIAHHPSLVEAVKTVLRSSNILLWSSDFNAKEVKSRGFFPAHQDATYTGLSPACKCVTAWVALTDPVFEEQGCLCFWVGSHMSGQLSHVEGAAGGGSSDNENNMLSRKQRVRPDVDIGRSLAVPVALRGGEASLHHFHTLHKSGPNRTEMPRIGLALRYCDASVRQTGSVRESVTLISGSIEHDGFDIEPILPLEGHITAADYQKGRDAHEKALRRESANYFEGTDIAKEYD